MTSEIKAVVFDMDGVLFDTERLFLEAWKEVAAERRIVNIERPAFACVGLNVRDSAAVFAKEYGPDFPFKEVHDDAGRYFHEIVERDGLPQKPGVRELLSYLKEEGYRIALASSTGKRSVLEHLNRAGLNDYFEVVIGGDMIEHGKPEPDIYLKACEELGVEPTLAFAVEDSKNGLKSAYAAGLKPIMVPDLIPPTAEIEALLYAKCDSLFDVRELLMKRDGKLQETERIPLESLCNTRDLGGYRTADGRIIKKRRLIRSSALSDASAKDIEKLVREYDLKTIVDFRTSVERNLKPDPVICGVTYVENPILEEEAMGITREKENEVNGDNAAKKMIAAIRESGSTPLAYMEKLYVNLVAEPFSRAQYRKFFEILLAQEEGAVLWHCSAGKDRVGVGTMLLLSALGVSKEQIMADYVKINAFRKDEIDMLMVGLKDHVDMSTEEGRQGTAAIRLLFMVDREYLKSVYAAIEEGWGSVEVFLESEMGLTPERREKLKGMYLE